MWKERLTTGWDMMRIIRLGIGIMLLVMGIQTKDMLTGSFALFFLYQAVTGTGCCGSGGCYTPPPRRSATKVDVSTTDYEEIK